MIKYYLRENGELVKLYRQRGAEPVACWSNISSAWVWSFDANRCLRRNPSLTTLGFKHISAVEAHAVEPRATIEVEA